MSFFGSNYFESNHFASNHLAGVTVDVGGGGMSKRRRKKRDYYAEKYERDRLRDLVSKDNNENQSHQSKKKQKQTITNQELLLEALEIEARLREAERNLILGHLSQLEYRETVRRDNESLKLIFEALRLDNLRALQIMF